MRSISLPDPGPFFDQLAHGQVFDRAPAVTLTDGLAASHQAIVGDRLRLPLDRHLSAAVTGAEAGQGASVLGALARELERGEISHDAAVQVLVQLVAAGIESTVGHLGTLVWRLGGSTPSTSTHSGRTRGAARRSSRRH